MRKLLLCATAVLLGGCMTAPVPAAGGTCRSEGLGAFAGREVTAATGAEIQRVSGARVMRWVQPGMAVTMEFSADRVTVWLAANNRIDRVNCG